MCRNPLTKIIALVLSVLLLSACHKETLTVRDLPLSELTASFYVLKEGTIEIPADKMQEWVLGRRGDEIRVQNIEAFQGLTVGDVVMSALDTDRELILFRKVVSISDQGNMLILQTEDASLPDAMSEFYFNSELPDVFGFKSTPYNFSQVTGSFFQDLFSAIGINPSFPIIITPQFSLSGQVDFEIIHPHTAYKYFACNNDDACFQAIDTTDANPRNGYYDVVDAYFNNQLDPDLTQNGLYTIKISQFGVNTFGANLGTKRGTGQAVSFDIQTSVEEIENRIKQEISNNYNSPTLPDLGLHYYPTGLTFWGLVSLNIPFSTIMEIEMDAAAFLSLALNFSNKVDIQMGHVNWNSRVPSPLPAFRVTRNGNPASMTDILLNPALESIIGINGSMKVRSGIGIGAALSIGEANRLGKSVGALLEVAKFARLHGGAGARFTDILNTNNQRNFMPFGQLCFDFGFEFDAFLFTDLNFVGVDPLLGGALDIKIKIPKETFGLSNFSFMSLLPQYVPDNGLCFGFLGCEYTVARTFNFGLMANNELRVEFEVENELLTPGTYELAFKTPQGNFPVTGTFEYGARYTQTITNIASQLTQALVSGDLEVEIKGQNNGCLKVLKPGDYGFLLSCDTSPYEGNELGLGETRQNLVGDEITFFTKQQAQQHCNRFNPGMATPDYLSAELADRPCVNPTGFLIENLNDNDWSTQQQAFIWIQDQANGDDLLIIEFENKSGQGTVRSFKTSRASPSLRAAAICIDL